MNKAVKEAIDQWRLLIAEKLIFWAMEIAPKGHKDSTRIIHAAAFVATRKPT